jgi:LytS/YehU family sensor histidine kinase
VIAAELEQDRLVLRVTDNGEGLKREPARQKGSGLAITRGRLATLYGPHHSLVLRNVRPCGVEARISVPFHLHAHTYFEKDNVELQSTDR